MSDPLDTLVAEMDEDIASIRARFAGLSRRLVEVTRQRDWAECDLEDRRQSFETLSERFTDAEQACRQAQAELAATRTPCTWREDEEGRWTTGCSHAFQFSHDPPYDYVKFCCYCGGHTTLIPFEEVPVE